MSSSNNFKTKLFNMFLIKIEILRSIQKRYDLSVDNLNYETNDKIEIADGE